MVAEAAEVVPAGAEAGDAEDVFDIIHEDYPEEPSKVVHPPMGGLTPPCVTTAPAGAVRHLAEVESLLPELKDYYSQAELNSLVVYTLDNQSRRHAAFSRRGALGPAIWAFGAQTAHTRYMLYLGGSGSVSLQLPCLCFTVLSPDSSPQAGILLAACRRPKQDKKLKVTFLVG